MSELVSFTEVDLLRQCARRFWFERVKGERQPSTAEMLIGECYHRIMELVVRNALVKRVCGVQPPFAKLCDAGVEHVFAKRAAKGDSLYDLDPLKVAEDAQKNLGPLEKFVHPLGLWPILVPKGSPDNLEPALELFFRSETLGYLGVIDIISANTPIVNDKGAIVGFREGQHCVIDYKVKSGKRRRSVRDAQLSDQLATYASVVDERCAAFIEIPVDDRVIVTRVVSYTDQDIADWRGSLIDQAKYRNALRACEDNPAFFPMTSRSNPLCSPLYCPFYAKCYPMEGQRAEQGEVSQA